jgi:hypothetical protein
MQGAPRGCLTPFEASPDPLRESRYKLSLGNICQCSTEVLVHSLWTPFILGAGGAQVSTDGARRITIVMKGYIPCPGTASRGSYKSHSDATQYTCIPSVILHIKYTKWRL